MAEPSSQTNLVNRSSRPLILGVLIVLLIILAFVLFFIFRPGRGAQYSTPANSGYTSPSSQLPSHNTTGTSNGSNPNGTSPAPSPSGTTPNVSGNPKVDQ